MFDDCERLEHDLPAAECLAAKNLVEPDGIEPTTSSLQS